MIKILGIDDFSEIYNKRLVNDFPESEVKSLKKIIDMYKKDMYFVYGYYNENGELAGYAFFINDRTKDTVLLDYFAIVLDKSKEIHYVDPECSDCCDDGVCRNDDARDQCFAGYRKSHQLCRYCPWSNTESDQIGGYGESG